MQLTWVWVGSVIWWWTGKADVLQSMGSQRVGRDLMAELNWTEWIILFLISASTSAIGLLWGINETVWVKYPGLELTSWTPWTFPLFTLSSSPKFPLPLKCSLFLDYPLAVLWRWLSVLYSLSSVTLALLHILTYMSRYTSSLLLPTHVSLTSVVLYVHSTSTNSFVCIIRR